MKRLFIILLIVINSLVGAGQPAKPDAFVLSVSPVIDREEPTNQLIISALKQFFQTKNDSPSENRFWERDDFIKYTYPYLDIYKMEDSKKGAGLFKPVLMEILQTAYEKQKIVKVAFIAHDTATGESQLKSIFNFIANTSGEKVLFSRYLRYSTANWKRYKAGKLLYIISPLKKINKAEILRQQKDIQFLDTFFNAKPFDITYYSCLHPKEVFEIKGFDYNSMMYAEKTGGFAEYGNLIFSGNNAEVYTHEAVHLYMDNVFGNVNNFLNEGIATYLAGSGLYNYEWHRKQFDRFLDQNTGYDFAAHTDVYEQNYFEKETPVIYLTAALICERTLRLYGKQKLFQIFRSEKDTWDILETVGLNRQNINSELRKEIKRPIKKAAR